MPADEILVLFRKIGYSPRALRLNLSGRENRTIDLGGMTLNGVVVKLDSITIETRLVSRNPRLQEFYRRKAQGMGQYLTRHDIYLRNPMTATDLMRMIPGVTVECIRLGPCVPSSMRKIQAGEIVCPMRIMLDGFPTAIELDMIRLRGSLASRSTRARRFCRWSWVRGEPWARGMPAARRSSSGRGRTTTNRLVIWRALVRQVPFLR